MGKNNTYNVKEVKADFSRLNDKLGLAIQQLPERAFVQAENTFFSFDETEVPTYFKHQLTISSTDKTPLEEEVLSEKILTEVTEQAKEALKQLTKGGKL